jgi:transcriptional regulator with XRE-family HTH domain
MVASSTMTAAEMTEIGRRVRAWRKVVGLKQNELAQVIGVDNSSLSKIEQGKKPLSATMAMALHRRYGLCMNFIYFGAIGQLPARVAADVLAEMEADSRG